jgi:hypothetical protein
MAIQTINSDVVGHANRGDGSPAALRKNLEFVANTSSEKRYLVAPCSGILARVRVQGTVTSDATKTYTYVVTNETKADVMTAASQVYDADPVLTANTYADLSLDSTGVAVTEGDMIEVDFTGGTGSGLTAVELVFLAR